MQNQIVIQRPGRDPEVFYTPLPHQAAFHAATEKFVLMEGGAGSGKSKAIRTDAYMRCLAIPRFRALILRRQMPELRLSHLDFVPFEAEQLGLPKDAFHTTHSILRFPNGSTLTFGHVEDDQSLPRYLSSEFEAIYFDELATFTLRQFKFLASRARTTIKDLVPIIRGGTNPIGIGSTWVRRYFITKNVPEAEDPSYRPERYRAIHSTVDDNPHVDEGYKTQLEGLPSDALRRAMRHGEWLIEGQFFSEWSPLRDGRPWHVIPAMPTYHGVPIQFAPHIEIVVAIDWGYSKEGNPGVALWFACLEDGSAIGFQEYVFSETLPEQVAVEIKRRSEGLRVRYYVGDTAMWAEHSGPSIAEKLARAGVSMIEADKEREPGWIEVHTWLRETRDDGTGARPRLSFLETGCPVTIQAMPDMTVDPKNPADMLTTGVPDDGPDDIRYFVMSRPGKSRARAAVVNPAVVAIRQEIAKKERRRRWRVGWESARR